MGKYQVNMDEAAQPDITQYECFNDFFTRALKPGARPLADAARFDTVLMAANAQLHAAALAMVEVEGGVFGRVCDSRQVLEEWSASA